MTVSRNELAILRTVLYSALFDYPLSLRQVRCSLLQSVQDEAAILHCYQSSPWLQELIDCRDGFFFPRGADHLLAKRRARERKSRAHLDAHRWLLNIICAVPYTRLVALSGSAAHLNLGRDADLDLFIITRGKQVWSVTVTILLLAKLFRRRKLACVNFVLSDERLELDQQDLFTANQIIHLRPLTGAAVHARFLAANPFVAEFYPNFSPTDTEMTEHRESRVIEKIRRGLELLLWPGPSQLYEALCRAAYSRYLRQRASSWQSPGEVRLQRDCLKLHTQSHRRSVLGRFERTVEVALVRSDKLSQPVGWV